MERCRETAFCLTLWYAVLTVIVAVLAIALHDLDRSASLLAAANVALMFALVLMARAGRLTDSQCRARTVLAHSAAASGRVAKRARGLRDVHCTRRGSNSPREPRPSRSCCRASRLVSNGADQAKAARAQGIALAPLQSNFEPAYRVVRRPPMN